MGGGRGVAFSTSGNKAREGRKRIKMGEEEGRGTWGEGDTEGQKREKKKVHDQTPQRASPLQ